MKILALDSSGLVASVAYLEEDKIKGLININYQKTHSQTLLPMLDEMVKTLEINLDELDCLACANGPGSFTGLRIGSATAKGLGLALNIPIVEISTTEGLAFNLFGTDKLIAPIMDARREQVYTGLYEFEGDELKTILPATAEPVEDTVARINETNRPVIFLGDGVAVFKDRIMELIKVPVSFAPAGRRLQSAASVATLGLKALREGKAVPAKDHVPDYLRLSQAEREREENK